MKDYRSAYKAFDIRSIWQDPVDNTFAYSLGDGIGKYLLSTVGPHASVIFSSDVREANNTLIYWFLKGLENQGIMNYVNLGVAVKAVDDEQKQMWGVGSTSFLYYVNKGSFDVGVMITASHNSAEYVGMKIVNNESSLQPSDFLSSLVEEYTQVPDGIDMDDFDRILNWSQSPKNPLRKIVDEKIKSMKSLLLEKFSKIEKKYTFVVDYSNGAAVGYEAQFIKELLSDRGHTILELNNLADSNFESHLSDTTDPHDYKQLIAKIIEVNADFGIMFDGDADRLGFVDNRGRIIGGDVTGAMIAVKMLESNPEKKNVIHDVFYTKAAIERIQEMGGKPIKCRVGHKFIKESFKKHDALFGGEISSHLFFNEIGGFESPLIALYYMMQVFDGVEKVSDAVDPYLKYCKLPLRKYIISTNEKKQEILDAIAVYFKDYQLDYTDGVGVYGDDFWFVIRMSHTEPVLKMVMEADTRDVWDKRVLEIERLID